MQYFTVHLEFPPRNTTTIQTTPVMLIVLQFQAD